LIWLEQNGAEERIVEVAVGNQLALGFYFVTDSCPEKRFLNK
jgi:hypothetical protein